MAGAYHYRRRILTGFSGGVAVGVGCVQGDGSLAAVTQASVETSAGNALDPGVVPIALTAPEVSTSGLAYLNHQIPTLATFVKDNPPKTKLGKEAMQDMINLYSAEAPYLFIAAPRGTPLKYVEALRYAFTSAMSQADVKAAFEQLNTIPGLYPVNKINSWIKSQLKAEPVFRRYVTPAAG